MSFGPALPAPEPSKSKKDNFGLKKMPSPVSIASSLEPSMILYFLRNPIGIVACPFLVTTTSVIVPSTTKVEILRLGC